MMIKAAEIFINSLAYSFWPFLFIVILIYLLNKYFNHGYAKSVDKQNRILGKNKEYDLPDLPEETLSFKTPKIETSFGNQRIGDVHDPRKKT